MSQKNGSNEPMTSVVIENKIREWVDGIELRESQRTQSKRPDARAILARKWNVSYWILTNFRRGRLKDLRGTIRDQICAGVIHEMAQEISRLSHELQLAHQCGAGPNSDEITALETAMEKAREVLARGSQ